MSRDQFKFLFGGLAFGILLGFGLFRAIDTRPGHAVEAAAPTEIPGPMGPAAATQTAGSGAGAGSGAPMMAEISALKERVQKDPKDAEAWMRLANLYLDAGMFEPAIELYQRAIALAPGNASLLTDMAICHQELKHYDEALELLERAQKVDPANWQSLYNIVVVAGLQLRRFDKADAALARLEQIHPDAPNLGQLRDALNKAR